MISSGKIANNENIIISIIFPLKPKEHIIFKSITFSCKHENRPALFLYFLFIYFFKWEQTNRTLFLVYKNRMRNFVF